jgi:hypothetical protein
MPSNISLMNELNSIGKQGCGIILPHHDYISFISSNEYSRKYLL